MADKITTKNFWQGFWSIENKSISIKKINDLPFSRLLYRNIEKSLKKGSALEVGCYPGYILAYICRTFNYFPEGLDYLDDEKTFAKVLAKNGLARYRYYKKDFFKWETSNKYDLVCSFGFIEHFNNPERALAKHVELLKKGGTLLINVPNFNGLRYVISYFTDKETLSKHNMDVMNRKFYLDFAKKHNLKIKFLDYYGRFEYTWCNRNPSIFQKLIYYPFKILNRILLGYSFRNKLMSGWLFFIAEKNKS